jgi:hypothetical protein
VGGVAVGAVDRRVAALTGRFTVDSLSLARHAAETGF